MFSDLLKNDTGWIEGVKKPRADKKGIHPVAASIGKKEIVFFSFEERRKKIKSIYRPDKSERGIFQFQRTLTLKKKGSSNKFIYMYNRIASESKFKKKLQKELEKKLLGQSPGWIKQGEKKSNRWGHFTFKEIISI